MRNHLNKLLILAVGASLTLAGCGGDGGGSAPGLDSPAGIATTPIDDGNVATPPAVFATPAAINANNELVGTAESAAGAVLQPASWVVDNAGAATVSATSLLTIDDRFAAAYDLSDSGVVVGSAENLDTSIRAAVWADSAAIRNCCRV